MVSILIFMCFCNSELRIKNEFVVQIPSVRGLYDTKVSADGFIFISDYWGSQVFKVDKGGKLIATIGRPGEGPGEMQKPMVLLLLNNDKTLLVIESRGKWHWFDTSTYKMIRNSRKAFASSNAISYAQGKILVIGRRDNGSFLHLMSEDGDNLKSWGMDKYSKTNVYGFDFALAVDPEMNIYYQEGAESVVNIYTEKTGAVRTWSPKLPAGYRPKPKNSLSTKFPWSKDQRWAFQNSFTHLSELYVIGEYMVVQWKVNTTHTYSIDLYSFPERQLLEQNFLTDNRIVAVRGDSLYLLSDSDESYKIQILEVKNVR